MGIDYYYTPGSAPCRIVLLTAKALGLDLNLKLVDLMKGEHLKPEYMKVNPQHNVPCIVDGDLTLTESRAIATYLVSKYGKDDSLYPKDPKKRAIVDQRLYFDMGTLYQRFGDVYYPIIFEGAPLNEAKAKRLEEAYSTFDGFLAKTGWAAGDHMTVADLALVASVTTAEVCGVNIAKHPNVSKWLAKCKSSITGYKEANEEGVMKFKGMYEASKKK